MNKLTKVLEEKKENLLSVYFTAGFPNLDDTQKIISQLNAKGVDIIEIGLPFSDPIADGLIIQDSSNIAIKNGMNINVMFEQVAQVSKDVKCGLVLMGYLNPIFHFGIEKTFQKCQEAGIDAMIIPDLPLAEYISDWKPFELKYGVKIAMLISPQSSDERIREIDENTDSFIYVVSMASVTGTKDDFSDEQVAYFQRISDMNLKNKTLIGFGISNKKTLEKAQSHSSGAIIGSAFIKCLKAENNTEKAIDTFLTKIHS